MLWTVGWKTDDRQGVEYILDHLKQDDASPASLTRYLPPEPHLEQQLGKADQLERTSGPFVSGILLAPCAGVASVR